MNTTAWGLGGVLLLSGSCKVGLSGFTMQQHPSKADTAHVHMTKCHKSAVNTGKYGCTDVAVGGGRERGRMRWWGGVGWVGWGGVGWGGVG